MGGRERGLFLLDTTAAAVSERRIQKKCHRRRAMGVRFLRYVIDVTQRWGRGVAFRIRVGDVCHEHGRINKGGGGS